MKLLFILLLGLGFTQTKLETRVYEISLNMIGGQDIAIDIEELTGYDLEYAILKIINVQNYSSPCGFTDLAIKASYYGVGGSNESKSQLVRLNDYGIDYHLTDKDYIVYHKDSFNPYNEIDFWSDCNLEVDFMVSIEAPFPEEDTGYIEEGYQFCVQPGANLLSFPCDNPINVGESLPQGVENFITEIVGQGVAASYNPALGWIGNLAEFTPGSGYWFKSNESLCFEYDCVED